MTSLRILLAVLLVASGCGGGSETATPATTAPPGTTEAPAATTAAPTTTSAPETTEAPTTTAPAPTTTEAWTSEESYDICLVTTSAGRKDKAFNEETWTQLEWGRGMNANFRATQRPEYPEWRSGYVEAREGSDGSEEIALFVDAGCDAIVTVGAGMTAATEAAAGRHPDVDFIGADQAHDVSLPNLAGVSFGEDRAGFLAGALAASVTSSRTVAVVLDAEDPTSGDLKAGFANGVAHVDAAVEVVSVTAGADEGAAAAREAMDAGADVVFAAGARSNADVLLKAAAEPGVLCIGVGGDQWYTVSDARPCLVSSARKAPHWMWMGEGVIPALASVVNMSFGEFAGVKGRVFYFGNRAGMVILAPYHDHKDAVPRDVRDMLEALAKSLLSGDLLACVREDCP